MYGRIECIHLLFWRGLRAFVPPCPAADRGTARTRPAPRQGAPQWQCAPRTRRTSPRRPWRLSRARTATIPRKSKLSGAQCERVRGSGVISAPGPHEDSQAKSLSCALSSLDNGFHSECYQASVGIPWSVVFLWIQEEPQRLSPYFSRAPLRRTFVYRSERALIL